MPSVRFFRDKRGYEYVYLMHTSTRRGKPGRSHVLYWYRTPPGVLIGRKPFSEDVQRMLKTQNPGVAFDWPAIISTPMPPPDMTEFWRERRRAAKAAKQQSRSQDADENDIQSEGDEPQSGETSDAAEPVAESAAPDGLQVDVETVGDEPAQESAGEDAGARGEDAGARKRRRRRGGRRRKGGTEQQAQIAEGGPAEDAQSSSTAPAPIESDNPPEPAK